MVNDRSAEDTPRAPAEIAAAFSAEGLEVSGVADAVRLPEDERRYHEWIKRGHHGSMAYLERHAPAKHEPSRILPGCVSIIFAAVSYAQSPPRRLLPGHGRVSMYAWGRDYHNALGKRLKRVVRRLERSYPHHRFSSGTDSTPLAERAYARRAGIGFSGRNTLLIHPRFGSSFFVGEILSTMYVPATGPEPGARLTCPDSCSRCSDACPTGALYEPYQMDARRCISYLTIEHRGDIDLEIRPLIGDRLFGCDCCQSVCPLNAEVSPATLPDFTRQGVGPSIELQKVLRISDDAEYSQLFAGTPLHRTGRERLTRNAGIVAANTGATGLIPDLRRCAGDESPLIRAHAAWALEILS